MQTKEEFNSDINPKNYYGNALEENDLYKLEKYRNQRNERGFDDSETWSLDFTIASFIVPRLKRLIEIEKELGVTATEYFSDLEKQIEILEKHDVNQECDLSLLKEHFTTLWW